MTDCELTPVDCSRCRWMSNDRSHLVKRQSSNYRLRIGILWILKFTIFCLKCHQISNKIHCDELVTSWNWKTSYTCKPSNEIKARRAALYCIVHTPGTIDSNCYWLSLVLPNKLLLQMSTRYQWTKTNMIVNYFRKYKSS